MVPGSSVKKGGPPTGVGESLVVVDGVPTVENLIIKATNGRGRKRIVGGAGVAGGWYVLAWWHASCRPPLLRATPGLKPGHGFATSRGDNSSAQACLCCGQGVHLVWHSH